MEQPAAAKGPIRRRFPVGCTDDYVVFCRLGSGSFGTVVLARHRVTRETVAIKRVRSSGGAGNWKFEIMREAGFLEKCKGQPAVVEYRGLVRDRRSLDLCLVMEFVGPSLHHYLRQRRRLLPEATVCSVMRQLLMGAQKMHQCLVVHRDIKPANILVGGDHRTVKLCDLGLAMDLTDRPPYGQAGTLTYMAPEVLLGKTDYDALVDSWSLGCVMAELINGRPMFERSDEGAAGQLSTIFNMLGVPDKKTWPGFASLPLAPAAASAVQAQQRNRLRELFPEERLSKEAFDVLNGLLSCNPDKRLTAAAALKRPWFAKVDTPPLSLKEEDAESALPKKKRVLMIPPRPLPKRLKVICA